MWQQIGTYLLLNLLPYDATVRIHYSQSGYYFFPSPTPCSFLFSFWDVNYVTPLLLWLVIHFDFIQSLYYGLLDSTWSGTQLPLNSSAVPSVTHGASTNWPPDYCSLSLWNHHPWELCTCCFFSLECSPLIYLVFPSLVIFAQMLPSQKVFPDHPSWNVSSRHSISLYLDSFFP